MNGQRDLIRRGLAGLGAVTVPRAERRLAVGESGGSVAVLSGKNVCLNYGEVDLGSERLTARITLGLLMVEGGCNVVGVWR